MLKKKKKKREREKSDYPHLYADTAVSLFQNGIQHTLITECGPSLVFHSQIQKLKTEGKEIDGLRKRTF